MENQTAFDLDEQIQLWRQKLAQSPAFRAENLEELEAHLRDSVARLEARGLTGGEAFQLATRRMGGDGLLAAEFGKVNRREIWLVRIFWMLVGLQLLYLLTSFTISVANTISMLVFSRSNALENWNITHSGILHGLALPVAVFTAVRLLTLTAGLALGGWLILRKGRHFGRWLGHFIQRRHVLVVCGLIFSVMLMGNILAVAPTILILKFMQPALPGARVAQSMSALPAGLGEFAILLILALMLARKGFKLSRTSRVLVTGTGGGMGPSASPPPHLDAHEPSPGSFELGQQVKNWLENQALSPILAGGKPEELESRLRASISHLQAQGLATEEAFLIGTQRLGEGSWSALEVRVVDASAVWAERMLWMLVGLLLWRLVYGLVNPMAGSAAACASLNLKGVSPIFMRTVAMVIQLSVMAGNLAICWWLVLRRGPVLEDWIKRTSARRAAWLTTGGVLSAWMLGRLANFGYASISPLTLNGEANQAVMQSVAFASNLSMPCETVTLIILTVLLARKILNQPKPCPRRDKSA